MQLRRTLNFDSPADGADACGDVGLGRGFRSIGATESANGPVDIATATTTRIDVKRSFFDIYVIGDQNDRAQFDSFRFEAEAGGRIYGFEGKGAYRRDVSSSIKISQSSLVVILALEVIDHACALSSASLGRDAAQLSATNRLDDFYITYGDEFVRSRTFGASWYLVMEIQTSFAGERRRMRQSASAEVNYLTEFSANSSASWNSLRTNISKGTKVSVTSKSFGFAPSASAQVPILRQLNASDAYDSLDALVTQFLAFAPNAAQHTVDPIPEVATDTDPAETAIGFVERVSFADRVEEYRAKFTKFVDRLLLIENAMDEWVCYKRQTQFFDGSALDPNIQLQLLTTEHRVLVDSVQQLTKRPWASLTAPSTAVAVPVRRSVSDVVDAAFSVRNIRVFFSFSASEEMPAADLAALGILPGANYVSYVRKDKKGDSYVLQVDSAKPKTTRWNKAKRIVLAGKQWQSFPIDTDGVIRHADVAIGSVKYVEA